MIKATLAIAVLAGTMLVGGYAHARVNTDASELPCILPPYCGFVPPIVKQAVTNTPNLQPGGKAVTPSIPIPPPVRSR
jgi:hypothetical protein